MKTFSFNTMASVIPPVYEKKAKYGKYGAFIWDPTVGGALFIFNDYGDHEKEWTDLRLKDMGRSSLLPYEKYALAFSWWAYRQKSRRDAAFAYGNPMGQYRPSDLETGQMHPEDSPVWGSHYKYLLELRAKETTPDPFDVSGEGDNDDTVEYSDLKAQVAMALDDGEDVISIDVAVALVAHIESLNDVIAQRAISDLAKEKAKTKAPTGDFQPTEWFEYWGSSEDTMKGPEEYLDIDEINSYLSKVDSEQTVSTPAAPKKRRGRKPKQPQSV